MPKADLDAIEETNRTGYPPPFDGPVSGRWYRRLAPRARPQRFRREPGPAGARRMVGPAPLARGRGRIAGDDRRRGGADRGRGPDAAWPRRHRRLPQGPAQRPPSGQRKRRRRAASWSSGGTAGRTAIIPTSTCWPTGRPTNICTRTARLIDRSRPARSRIPRSPRVLPGPSRSIRRRQDGRGPLPYRSRRRAGRGPSK